MGACACASPRLTRHARPQVHLYNTMVVREALVGAARDRHERSEHASALSASPSQASASHDSDLFETWMVMGAARRRPRPPHGCTGVHGARLRACGACHPALRTLRHLAPAGG